MTRFLALLCLLACLAATRAAEVSVSAGVSQNVAALGEEVQFHITIKGARGGQPPAVQADGLEIRYLGPSESTSMRIENGRVSNESSVIHVYSVQARREGSFTIPAATVEVDGRQFRTEPVGLKIEKGGGTSAGGLSAQGELEIVLPKTTAYVGEVIPVEIRLSVDAQVRWEPQAMPDLEGDGFTKQKMPEPRRENGRKDGRDMDVLVFRTAITPGKAGKLQFGPVEVPYVALVPRARRQQRRGSLFDLFNDDVFSDQAFAVRQQFRARAEAVELDVKPLPAAGRPPAFSGAIGRFAFTAEGSPRQVKIGDPVTMKLTVSGSGNFDRIEAPALVDSTGWRAYPPSADFKPGDDLSLTGTKTFDMAVIPEAKKTAMPAFEFSYFDPATAKYVTLKSTPAPLTVEGAPPPPPAPAPTADGAASQFGAQDRATEPPKQASDILGVRYDEGSGRRSFQPLFARPAFWLAQLVPLAGLLALVAAKFLRPGTDNTRAGKLRREKAAALATLRRGDLAEPEFLETAARICQIETALATGREPGTVDAAAVRSACRLDAESAQVVDEVFDARAALLYAGAGVGGAALTGIDRQRVLVAIERMGRSLANG